MIKFSYTMKQNNSLFALFFLGTQWNINRFELVLHLMKLLQFYVYSVVPKKTAKSSLQTHKLYEKRKGDLMEQSVITT